MSIILNSIVRKAFTVHHLAETRGKEPLKWKRLCKYWNELWRHPAARRHITCLFFLYGVLLQPATIFFMTGISWGSQTKGAFQLLGLQSTAHCHSGGFSTYSCTSTEPFLEHSDVKMTRFDPTAVVACLRSEDGAVAAWIWTLLSRCVCHMSGPSVAPFVKFFRETRLDHRTRSLINWFM